MLSGICVNDQMEIFKLFPSGNILFWGRRIKEENQRISIITVFFPSDVEN